MNQLFRSMPFQRFCKARASYSPQYRLIVAAFSNLSSMTTVFNEWYIFFVFTARIEYENYYMTQSSQRVISPGSNVNISGPLPGTFHHSKEVAIAQPSPDTARPAMRRPQMQLPNIPAPGKMRPTLVSLRPCPHASGYFWIHNFFFPDSKISSSTRPLLNNNVKWPNSALSEGREPQRLNF